MANRLNSILKSLGLSKEPEEEQAVRSGGIAPYWCVAANLVRDETVVAAGSVFQTFKPGEKLHVVNSHWHGGKGRGKMTVVGRHRVTEEYVTITMPSMFLTNWRAELTYSPPIIQELKKHDDFGKFEPNSIDDKQKAETIASTLSQT